MVNFSLGNSGGERWLRSVPGGASVHVPSDALLVFLQGKTPIMPS
jgi:hypothetical protein